MRGEQAVSQFVCAAIQLVLGDLTIMAADNQPAAFR